MNIPNGSIVTWNGSWTNNFPVATEQDISSQLSQMGFTVKSVHISSGLIAQVIGQYLEGTFVVQTNGGDFNDSTGVGDGQAQVQNMIAMAINLATGSFPLSSSITDVQVPPGSNTGKTTPGTDVATTCQGGIGGFLGSLFGSCKKAPTQSSSSSSSFLSSLTSSSVLYVGLAIFGFVAALALIGYSGALKRV